MSDGLEGDGGGSRLGEAEGAVLEGEHGVGLNLAEAAVGIAGQLDFVADLEAVGGLRERDEFLRGGGGVDGGGEGQRGRPEEGDEVVSADAHWCPFFGLGRPKRFEPLAFNLPSAPPPCQVKYCRATLFLLVFHL